LQDECPVVGSKSTSLFTSLHTCRQSFSHTVIFFWYYMLSLQSGGL